LRVTASIPAELLGTLHELAPNFISWVLSILLLALFWAGNHRLYSHVRHVDGLLPFASAVNSRYL
jgi:uncharacterized membrane protein